MSLLNFLSESEINFDVGDVIMIISCLISVRQHEGLGGHANSFSHLTNVTEKQIVLNSSARWQVSKIVRRSHAFYHLDLSAPEIFVT